MLMGKAVGVETTVPHAANKITPQTSAQRIMRLRSCVLCINETFSKEQAWLQGDTASPNLRVLAFPIHDPPQSDVSIHSNADVTVDASMHRQNFHARTRSTAFRTFVGWAASTRQPMLYFPNRCR